MSELNYTAPWELVEFPDVPPDAPREIQQLSRKVYDPKRVYIIYQATRRHNIGVLIQDFIRQIRYGCGSTNCFNPTCFSYRHKLAGDRTVRRFNQTSARALAVHLASQDNPERHLCSLGKRRSKTEDSGSHTVSTGEIPHVRNTGAAQSRDSTAVDSVPSEDESTPQSAVLSGLEEFPEDRNPKSTPGTIPATEKTLSLDDNDMPKGGNADDDPKPCVEDEVPGHTHSGLEFPRNSTTIDSKSFVQNLFDTAAFRFLEWFIPEVPNGPPANSQSDEDHSPQRELQMQEGKRSNAICKDESNKEKVIDPSRTYEQHRTSYQTTSTGRVQDGVSNEPVIESEKDTRNESCTQEYRHELIYPGNEELIASVKTSIGGLDGESGVQDKRAGKDAVSEPSLVRETKLISGRDHVTDLPSPVRCRDRRKGSVTFEERVSDETSPKKSSRPTLPMRRRQHSETRDSQPGRLPSSSPAHFTHHQTPLTPKPSTEESLLLGSTDESHDSHDSDIMPRIFDGTLESAPAASDRHGSNVNAGAAQPPNPTEEVDPPGHEDQYTQSMTPLNEKTITYITATLPILFEFSDDSGNFSNLDSSTVYDWSLVQDLFPSHQSNSDLASNPYSDPREPLAARSHNIRALMQKSRKSAMEQQEKQLRATLDLEYPGSYSCADALQDKEDHVWEEMDRIAVAYDVKSSKHQKEFVEQSIFYNLGDAKNLILSFEPTSENPHGLDSQAVFHTFRTLHLVNRPLILNSLWNTVRHVFSLPLRLSKVAQAVNVASASTRISELVTKNTCEDDHAALILQLCLHALMAAMPPGTNWADAYTASKIRSEGRVGRSAPGWTKVSPLSIGYNDILSDPHALRLADRVFSSIAIRIVYQDVRNDVASRAITQLDAEGQASFVAKMILPRLSLGHGYFEGAGLFTDASRDLYQKVAPGLLFDWAVAVFDAAWDNSSKVTTSSKCGAALTVIAALFSKRADLTMVDGYFVTTFIATRMESGRRRRDDAQIPVEWATRRSDSRTIHLLDLPYLFSAEKKLEYFRSINFHRMSRAFETSTSMDNRISQITSPSVLLVDRLQRTHLAGRLETALETMLVLNVRRTHILEDALDQLYRREQRELFRPLKIRLGEDEGGEEGFDSGGVQQEFMRMAISEALDPSYGLFTIDERTRMAWLQPTSATPLWKFEMLGLLFSLALYNGLTLPVTFPQAMYAKLLGKPVIDLNHIVDGWQDLARNLDILLSWNETESGRISEVFCREYSFSIEVCGLTITREMVRGQQWPQYDEVFKGSQGAALSDNHVRLVDNNNRDDFVSDYIHWLTDVSIAPQFDAFKKGFVRCLYPKSLTLFTPTSLALALEGHQHFDIDELRSYTRYEGYVDDEPYIEDFWRIVRSFDEIDRKRLLEFVTASERIPAAGVKEINFVISKNGEAEMDGHLPTAYTCYGTLLLPMYSTRDVLRVKLGMAIQNAKGFGFA